MRVLLVGATGTIGTAVVQELQSDTQVISASMHHPSLPVDLACSASICNLYEQVGQLDAVICTAARGVVFAPVGDMTRKQYEQSTQSKMLGQIDLVIQGLRFIRPNGSFTLTTGIMNADPIATGSAAAMVNSGVEGFAKAAAIDMPDRQRINVVSPCLLTESAERYGALLPGHETVSAQAVALAYRKSVYGKQTGQVYRVGW